MAIKEGKDYYTAAQVKSILGINDSMLYTYVDNGALERIIPPGKKQGVYRRSEVDKLARELQTFIAQRKKKSTKFMRVSTEEEMRACQEISQELFGVGRNTVEQRMEIVEKNPDSYHMLRDEDTQQIIGYAAVMPLKQGKLEKVLSQEIPVRIDVEDIESFDGPKNIDLYLHAMGIKPGLSAFEKHTYGARLVSGIMELILNLGKDGINIGTIAARSNMPDGVRLMRHFGFTEIAPLTPERRTFIIEVEGSGIPFVMQYKNALKQWQEEHKIVEISQKRHVRQKVETTKS